MTYRHLPDPHVAGVKWCVVDGRRQHFSIMDWAGDEEPRAWFWYAGLWLEKYPATRQRIELWLDLTMNPHEP